MGFSRNVFIQEYYIHIEENKKTLESNGLKSTTRVQYLCPVFVQR